MIHLNYARFNFEYGEDEVIGRKCWFRQHTDEIFCTGYCKGCYDCNSQLFEDMEMLQQYQVRS